MGKSNKGIKLSSSQTLNGLELFLKSVQGLKKIKNKIKFSLARRQEKESWFLISLDTTSAELTEFSSSTWGALRHLIHFVGPCIFLCLWVCLLEKRLFAQELYLHPQALFGRSKLIPGPFLGRVHQLHHSPQTLCTQRDHSQGPLLCCLQWHTEAILWECLKSLVEGLGGLRFSC